MKKEIIDFVENELKCFKKNKAILNSILLEHNISILAQVLSDMPKSITNKFTSVTENLALNNRLSELEKDIKRVENWLLLLNDKEKFVINNFYFENKSYNNITHNWYLQNNIFYSNLTWKNIRKKSILKICEIVINSYL